MATYVVGDIHGCFDEWMELKESIECEDKDARFILVGDIVDRGPRILDMLKWALENITSDGKYQMIIGNHEDMKIELWRRYKKMKRTIKGRDFRDYITDPYGCLEYLWERGVTEAELDTIINWFEQLHVYKEIEVETLGKKINYIIVHAAVPYECLSSNGKFKHDMLDKQHAEMWGSIENYRQLVIWDRNYFGNNWEHDTVVVHGHTPTLIRDLTLRGAIPGRIDFKYKDINIDCGMVYQDENSNLAAIRLEDLQEFYVGPLNDKYKHREKEIILKQVFGI